MNEWNFGQKFDQLHQELWGKMDLNLAKNEQTT